MMRALAVVLFTLSVAAQDAPSIAMLVRDPVPDGKRLQSALRATDPLTRATAARVIAVRAITDATPAVREALAKEANAEAAREQVRALVIHGSEADIAFAAKQLGRFPASIDSVFSDAIARRGAPAATELYLQYQPALRNAPSFAEQSLWGRSGELDRVVLRFIAANDARTVRALLSKARIDDVALRSEVIAAALRSDSTDIRAAGLWEVLAGEGAIPDPASREDASAEETFAREVLRRVRGAEKIERDDWLAWMRTPLGRVRVPVANAVRKHLTAKELDALEDKRLSALPAAPSAAASRPVLVPPFRLFIELPAGLAEKMLAKTRCNGPWLGTADVTVDRAGRVQTAKLNVDAEGKCAETAETMLRLSLAEPTRLDAELASPHVLLVKPTGDGCFDEGVVDDQTTELWRTGGEIVSPVVVERIQPVYPKSARQQGISGVVLAEVVVTRTGCVRDVRLIRQTPSPELNAMTLLALSKWKFKPAMLDGQPVDVIFIVNVNYRL